MISKHLDYNDSITFNDITLLKLEREVELNSKVQLACLPDRIQHPYPKQKGTTLFASGWG